MAKSLLLTRPKEDAVKDRKTFESYGFEVRLLPTIDFEPLPFEVPSLEDYDYLYFGSKRGVRFFLERVERIPDHLKVIAVGKKTAEELNGYGIKPFKVLKGSVSHLVELARKGELPKGKLLVPTAERFTEGILKVRNFGFELNILPVYRTVLIRYPLKVVLEAVEPSEVLVFTSPSTFRGLLINLQNHKGLIAERIIVAIGETTKRAIEREGFRVYWTPSEPSVAVMAREMAEALNGV